MAPRTERPRRSWLPGLGDRGWSGDDRAYSELLDALTRDRLETELIEHEMNATARTDMGAIAESMKENARDELAEAHQELGGFRVALQDARDRGGPSRAAEVLYDAADPVQDAQADALIQYLVRPGYAEVRTEEPEPGHYLYYLSVDWPRLRQLSEELGHTLPL